MTAATPASDIVVVFFAFSIFAAICLSWWATVKKLRISFKLHWLLAHLSGVVAGVIALFLSILVGAFYSVVSPVVGVVYEIALGYFGWKIYKAVISLEYPAQGTVDSNPFASPVQFEKSAPEPIKPIHIADLPEIEASRRQSLAAMKRATDSRQNDMKVRGEKVEPQIYANSTNTISDIEFDYRDASDNASHRRVEVHSIDDEYFEGFCHKAMATRTFVIGRVRGKVLDRDTGELLPPKKWASGVRNDPRNSGVVESRGWKSPDDIEEEERERPIEILFTGFSKERCAELEEQAAIFDLVVRKNVTKGLKYLCAGPNAGPAKLAKADEAGVEIIDESEFVQLLIKC